MIGQIEAFRAITNRAFVACVLALVLSLLMGGGTRPGFLSDAVLQLLTVPLLLAVFWHQPPALEEGARTHARLAMAFCLLLVLLHVLQLVPLPPDIWKRLPGTDTIIESFDLIGQPLPWRPASISPRLTWVSLVSLIPVLTVFFAAMQLDNLQRRIVSLLIVGFGVASVVLGMMQVAQGPSSPLRLFAYTNTMEAVGFFANRNHYSALLYTVLLLAAAWAAVAASDITLAIASKKYDTKVIIAGVASFTIVVMLVSAQALARSRAGLGLTIVALLGACLLPLGLNRSASAKTTARLLLPAALLALLFAVQFTLYRILERFGGDPLSDQRPLFARNTIEAAIAYMPFGSGMGTFVPVYAMFEKQADARASFVNRAHNDVLELWLEAGVLGLALLAAFALWVLVRAVAIWRGRQPGVPIDHLLARAATLIVPLVIAHSAFDYPLRTAAFASVFAFVCALLVPAPQGGDAGSAEEFASTRSQSRSGAAGRRTRRLAQAGAAGGSGLSSDQSYHLDAPWPQEPVQPTIVVPPPGLDPGDANARGDRWGSEVHWPDAWQPTDPGVPGANPAARPKPKPPERK